MTMLERDRETNILIRGLQNTVANILQLKAPSSSRDDRDIHDEADDDPGITAYDQESDDDAPGGDRDAVNHEAVDNSNEPKRGAGVY